MPDFVPDFVPDLARLTQIFSQATAPTFFLGAVAAFISLMSARLSAVVDRMRTLNAIAEGDPARAYLKADLERLRRRAHFLNSGIFASLGAGICATLLLAILFVSAFLNLTHAVGAPILFVVATLLLGFSLFRFAQDVRLGLNEADQYN